VDAPDVSNQRQPLLTGEGEFLPTRASLLGRLKDWEDRTSWQDFVDTYGRLVHSTALKAGLSESEAQDAVQDTFVAVAKNIGEFRYDPARCSFKSWLLLITRQRIIWQLRKRPPGNPPRPGGSDDSTRTATIDRIPDEASLNLDAHWEAQWASNLMAMALGRVKRQVKAKQFQIFDLAALQNWPVQDIARTLKVSAAQVYLARHRVGSLLKKELRRLAKDEHMDRLSPAGG
jgi:RNA polymerase sigma-70 factor (ECF subfamily)